MPTATPLPSALTTLIATHPPHPTQSPPHHALALQIQHNLQHQHDWTALRVHSLSPLTGKSLPRPLVSGVPPKRIYVHPDEQVEMLKRGERGEGDGGREWVLPSHVREKWSLRRFAEVFDGVGGVPPEGDGEGGGGEGNGNGNWKEGEGKDGKRWGGKRVLLATLGDDSTVVYYIMHDGIVKPRQN